MKVETPQILWNSEEEKGLNAALMSVSMIQSGIVDTNKSTAATATTNHSTAASTSSSSSSVFGNVLATAGNTNSINLWRVVFSNCSSNSSSNSSSNTATNTPTTGIVQRKTCHKIEYICSLTRHDAPVNAVAFSPDGLHLATAGDAGSIICWSVPCHKRGGGNGRHYWSSVTREQDLVVKIVARTGEGVADLSWSADSKRFLAGTIDHSVFLTEDANHSHNRSVQTCSSSSNHNTNGKQLVESDWKVVYRNAMDHTQYVQGVAYDPAGVYLASMSSDRTVRVYPRKAAPKMKKVLTARVVRHNKESRAQYAAAEGADDAAATSAMPDPHVATAAQAFLTETKVEMQKSKLIKYRRVTTATTTPATATTGVGAEDNHEAAATTTAASSAVSTATATTTTTSQQKRHLYADESTLESFFRRLAWTTDGAFLVTPCALWQEDTTAQHEQQQKSSSYATYLFARHKFDEPVRVLAGLEKPSVVVRPNPVLFTLPDSVPEASKENTSPKNEQQRQQLSPAGSSTSLPYRSIFCVLTWDTVLVYDTYQSKPLAVVRGLHYANLADATWSADGMHLVVCSTDGYISIVSFAPGELGQVYTPPVSAAATNLSTSSIPKPTANKEPAAVTPVLNPVKTVLQQPRQEILLPPCEPGESATIEAPPAKRVKVRITPTLVSASVSDVQPSSSAKRPADDDAEHVGQAVDKLSLNTAGTAAATAADEVKPKKKKRIQPTLLSTVPQQQ